MVWVMTPRILFALGALLAICQPGFSQVLFAPKQSYAAPFPSRPAFADFNGDGRLDMVTLANAGGLDTNEYKVYFYPGQNSTAAMFGSPTVGPTITSFASLPAVPLLHLVAADVDLDQKLDIVVGSNFGVFLLKGNGDGSFIDRDRVVRVSFNQGAIDVRDLNNDGKPDVYQRYAGAYYPGDGTGSFGTRVLLAAPCTGLGGRQAGDSRFADLNGDGRDELISNCTGGGVGVAYRNPDGSFGAIQSMLNEPANIAVGDFNRDGRTDLLMAAFANTYIRYGSMDGSLQPPTAVTMSGLNGDALEVLAGDYNFDGTLDLLVLQQNTFSYFGGTTNNLFTSVVSFPMDYPRSEYWTSVYEVLDLNGDKGLDFYNYSTSAINIYLTQPPSVFVSTSANPVAPGTPITFTAVIASPATASFYTSPGTVTFYNGPTPIGPGVSVNGGVATFTTSSLPQGIYYITASYQMTANSPIIFSKPVNVVVTPAACGTFNASNGSVQISASGFRYDRNTNQFVQDVDLRNTTGANIQGPVSLLVAGLSPNASLATPHSLSVCNQTGTPVVDAGICVQNQLAPNQSVRVTLRFNNPSRTPISYTPYSVTGLGQR